MTKYFEYKQCGCKFPLDNDNIIFDPDILSLNLECKSTWDLIGNGNTKGCFQLESRLGRSMAKKLKPENIEQLSALISIMRPGCLEAVRDGKTVSSHFIDKKNGLESVDYFHPSLEPILSNTFGEMVYQEQAMQIAKDIAGFDLQEADMLRKAIGKKKADEMAKLKDKFISGCVTIGGLSQQQADQIFSWIEKSQRYSFNKSHAVSYAMNAYLSAYSKAHFTRTFFASYLKFAKDKIDSQQEIKELIQNASQMNIHVSTPDIRKLNRYFVLKDKIIYFGLTDIKGVGQSVFNKLLTLTDESKLQEMGHG
jgi:DNA polymerase III subunit alpha